MNNTNLKQGCLLEKLVTGEVIASPIVIIIAHPDDETIGMGSRLNRLKNMTLVHVTSGSPAHMVRARRLGFKNAEDYSRTRFSELGRALSVLKATPARQIRFGFPDGETVYQMDLLIDRIQATIAGYAAVITHAYEGGHPDHDICALATQIACSRIADAGGLPPVRLEFACYHSSRGALVANSFCANSKFKMSEFVVPLSLGQIDVKRRAMREFRTQPGILEAFPPNIEAFREAPNYELYEPPPFDEFHYDKWSPIKGEAWIDCVRSNLKALR